MEGLTGHIMFNDDGKRYNYTLHIVQMTIDSTITKVSISLRCYPYAYIEIERKSSEKLYISRAPYLLFPRAYHLDEPLAPLKRFFVYKIYSQKNKTKNVKNPVFYFNKYFCPWKNNGNRRQRAR